jgi:hypothetical protein
MRYMIMVKADQNYEAGQPPSLELMNAIDKLSQEMMQQGVMVETGGLLPSAKGALVNVKSRKFTVTDGPFTEAKELVGGYAIIEAASRAEAIEQAKHFLQVHVDVLGESYIGECEIREMVGPFGPGVVNCPTLQG